jgi:leukotriene-A4 hydrolase
MLLSYLDVQDIKVDGEKVKWDLPARTEPYGSPITIKVGKDVGKNKEIEIAVSVNSDNSLIIPIYQLMSPVL